MCRMEWTGSFPDLHRIEHVSETLRGQVTPRSKPDVIIQGMEITLLQEWSRTLKITIDNIISLSQTHATVFLMIFFAVLHFVTPKFFILCPYIDIAQRFLLIVLFLLHRYFYACILILNWNIISFQIKETNEALLYKIFKRLQYVT